MKELLIYKDLHMELLVQILTISSVVMAGGAWLYDKLCKKFEDVQAGINSKVS